MFCSKNDYICYFDGEKATGFYDIRDKNLENNLIDQSKRKNGFFGACNQNFCSRLF